jgi:hypothetical protein
MIKNTQKQKEHKLLILPAELRRATNNGGVWCDENF